MYIGFAGCLALRSRSDRLKNSIDPRGTLPTHPVGLKKWTCEMRGLLTWPNTSFSYLLIWFTLYSGDRKLSQLRICWAADLTCFSEHTQKILRELTILESILFFVY